MFLFMLERENHLKNSLLLAAGNSLLMKIHILESLGTAYYITLLHVC